MTATTDLQRIGVQPAGYRLPDEARIGGVRLQVSDLAASLPFYTDVLGFSVLSLEHNHAALGARGGPALVELHERPGARRVPRRGHIGLYHFAVLLPDRPALGRLVAHLSDIGVPAGSADHLVSEALYLTDPDGLGIEVYADRPRAEWRTRGGEIAMATDPLDVRSVIRAAGGESWDGMPAGTTIGHVHFHVRTLGEAKTFYQDALGFDTVVWSYAGALFFSAGGYHHHVGTNTWATGAPVATAEDARLLEWELRLPTSADVSAVAANAARSGYDVRGDGGDSVITDPWGAHVRLASSTFER